MPEPRVRRVRKGFFTRVLLPLGITLLATTPFLLNAANIIHINLLHTIDSAIYDAKVNIMRADTIDPRVVIVDIDDPSLLSEGQWPWSRGKMAKLVDNLMNVYGVRAVGFDILFSEPDRVTHGVRALLDSVMASSDLDDHLKNQLILARNARDTDAEFAQALDSAPTVMGYIFTTHAQKGARNNLGVLPLGIDIVKLSEFSAYPYQPTGYLGNLSILQNAAMSGGYFDNPMVDSDGIFRRLPLLQYYNGQLYESLSLALLRVGERLSPPILGSLDEDGNPDVDFIQIDDFRIPVDDNLAILVPYRGHQRSFPYVSAADVLHERASIDTLFDTIVLVGTTAPGLFDMRSTPVDNIFPGVEIHANVISGILDRRIWFKPDWSITYDVVAICIALLILGLSMPLLSPIAGGLLVTIVIGLGVLLNFILAFGGLMNLPISGFVSCSFAVSIILIGINVITERRKKRYLSRTFSKYVPHELVAQFEKTESEVTLEGESRDMTILFSDVRDFTSISEHLPPQELTLLMNEYLTPITRIIQEYNGNVDKYIGDAVMAFWGAPLENPNHAQDAMDSAIRMQNELINIRSDFKQRGWPEIRVGIGLNTGVVNIGNMGSEFRTAYTVMGDVVNLASRLEGLSKIYDAEIVVGEEMVRQVKGYRFRELDRVRVKGKEAPITIYEPIGKEADITEQIQVELEQYSLATLFYQQHKWEQAYSAFEVLSEEYPEKGLYRLFATRCAEFIQIPPDKSWDGVYRMKTK